MTSKRRFAAFGHDVVAGGPDADDRRGGGDGAGDLPLDRAARALAQAQAWRSRYVGAAPVSRPSGRRSGRASVPSSAVSVSRPAPRRCGPLQRRRGGQSGSRDTASSVAGRRAVRASPSDFRPAPGAPNRYLAVHSRGAAAPSALSGPSGRDSSKSMRSGRKVLDQHLRAGEGGRVRVGLDVQRPGAARRRVAHRAGQRHGRPPHRRATARGLYSTPSGRVRIAVRGRPVVASAPVSPRARAVAWITSPAR